MSCSANSDLSMKIGIRIQSANTVLAQFDTVLISDKSFGAVCRSTHVQAVSLDPIYIYIYYIILYGYIYIYGSNDTACTLVELHRAPKDLTEMAALSNCV